MGRFDLAVVGAGIVGLAHALAAARRGLRVCVLERDARADSASARNFGFVTVSGQDEGDTRRRALRSRDVWEEVTEAAGIAVLQRSAVVVARRAEAFEVLEQFASGPMGAGCELWDGARAAGRLPALRSPVHGALSSPHELRVEAREALPRLTAWLAERHGVQFLWGVDATGFDEGGVRHRDGVVAADATVVAPGVGIAGAAPVIARRVGVRTCRLQMMRLAPPAAGFRLPGVVMTDLSLLRYGGFASQPAAARLRERLRRECGEALREGVHLIVAQGADGSLVVGDSHHYGAVAEAFSSAAVDALILAQLGDLFYIPAPHVTERWVGYYPVAEVQPLVREALSPRVRLVCVTSGTGMSTAFAVGEETIAELFA
jgi:D-hydroxyproline dehydrogenase subunit beta